MTVGQGPESVIDCEITAAPARHHLTIDAHVHVWDRCRSPYGWIPPGSALDRDFSPRQARTALDAVGSDYAVLVQADDTSEDTVWMLETGHQEPWVVGVVGWIPLRSPADAAAALSRYANEDLLVGVRHLIHTDPQPHFLRHPGVRESAELLASAGLALDIPDAFPEHLADAAELARAVPSLRLVIDHLGKPPVGRASMRDWERIMTELSELPNVWIKFSGLHHEGRAHSHESIRQLLSFSVETFGVERVVYGGDWPLASDGADPHLLRRATLDAIQALLDSREQEAVLNENARQLYRIPALRPE